MEEPSPISIEQISEADWEKTPGSVKQFVRVLMERVTQLEQRLAELEADNQQLREQVNLNSKNSSIPPSQDSSKGFKPKGNPRSSKKRGGQPGHLGHERKLYPSEWCQSITEHYPQACWRCGSELHGEDPQPYRYQIVELPPIIPQVEEHRFHQLVCPHCDAGTRALLPEIVNSSGYGEGVVATVALLSGMYRQSHQMVQQLLADLFGIAISVGSINQLRTEASHAVAEAVSDAQQYVQQQANVNMDETSFAQGNADGQNPQNRKGWLWVMVTPWVSYFEIFLSRAQAVAQQLLGQTFEGTVSSDRYSAYGWINVAQRQVCWAHLKRDFTQIAERKGLSGKLGQALLDQQQVLFELWYRVRDGTLGRAQFIDAVAPIQQQVHALLTEAANYAVGGGEKTPLAKTVRTCRQLLSIEPALWTFVTHEGIDPTNNAAERALRPAVLWRRSSFGSKSVAGSLFVARMLTVVTTLRAQQRNVLVYLVEACRAARQGQSPPSLLPAQNCTP